MDAGCNLRYILSNAHEAGDGRVITQPPTQPPPQPKAWEDTIWPTPRPTQIYKLHLSSSLGNHLFLYL